MWMARRKSWLALGIRTSWSLYGHRNDTISIVTEDVWTYIAITGSIYFCSGIVLLAGGLYWNGATRLGAWGALICGFSALFALGPIKEATVFSEWSDAQIGFFTIGLSIFGLIAGSLVERTFYKKPISS